jgi:magnesium transporter
LPAPAWIEEEVMLTAFARYPDGRSETLTSVEAIGACKSKEGSLLWVDIEEPGEADLQSIGEVFQLDAEALEDCLYGEQRPRIDEYEGHIFLVVYGVLGIDDTPTFEPRKLAGFCGSDFVVTVHHEPLRSIKAARSRCERNAAQVLGRGVDSVLYTIIDGMVDNYVILVEQYERQVDALEEASLDPAVGESILEDLHPLRRDLLEVRRIAESQRELLLRVTKGEFGYISETLDSRFAHVTDHLTRVVEMIDAQRELLNSVNENYQSALANRMNASMKTLAVVATLLLPLSLLVGIYGMNVTLWPGQSEPWGFWVVLAEMAALIVGMLVLFRRIKWL